MYIMFFNTYYLLKNVITRTLANERASLSDSGHYMILIYLVHESTRCSTLGRGEMELRFSRSNCDAK